MVKERHDCIGFEGSEGSEGSDGSDGSEGGGIALRAMLIKSALRDLPLCPQCYMTESQSPLPLEGGGAAGDGG